MYDTIRSFYQPHERPFVEALLFMARFEDDVPERAPGGTSPASHPWEVEGEPFGADARLVVWPTPMARARSGDIQRLKKPIIWFEAHAWRPKPAERIWRDTRAHLADAFASDDDPGADLDLEVKIDTTPELRREEARRKKQITYAFEKRSLYTLRRALAEYVFFYERCAQQLEEAEETEAENAPAEEVPA